MRSTISASKERGGGIIMAWYPAWLATSYSCRRVMRRASVIVPTHLPSPLYTHAILLLAGCLAFPSHMSISLTSILHSLVGWISSSGFIGSVTNLTLLRMVSPMVVCQRSASLWLKPCRAMFGRWESIAGQLSPLEGGVLWWSLSHRVTASFPPSAVFRIDSGSHVGNQSTRISSEGDDPPALHAGQRHRSG